MAPSVNSTKDLAPTKRLIKKQVVLLNSGYQLLNYVITERLKRIVE